MRRELRESVLFAQHDLLKDSPFSKLDLVTCRNLLIYLNREAQARALDIFHFSLVRQGLLFLGTSESVDETGERFAPLDKKHRLYAARPAVKVGLPVPVGIGILARTPQERASAAASPVLPKATGPAAIPARTEAAPWPRAEPPLGAAATSEAYLHILSQGGPASLIVSSQHDILHLSGTASRFLQFGVGESAWGVVGSFALYFEQPRDATARDRETANVITRAAAIIISRSIEATQRANAEAALRESEERMRTLADNLPGGAVFVIDRARRYRLAGGQALGTAGMKLADFLDRTVAEALGPEQAALYEPYFAQALAGEPFEYEHASHGRHYLSRGVPLRDPAGRVGSALVVSYDITDRKHAEEALQRSEERLRLVVESARDFAIFTFDGAGVVTSWNPGAQAIFGYAAQEVVGRSCKVMCTPEDRAIGRTEQEMAVARHEGRAIDERWHLRKDGTRFWGSGSLTPLHLDGKTSEFLMILSDRTEARNALEDAQRAREQAEGAGKAKDRFLAVLSHELRTPLTPITMALAVLANRRDLPEAVTKTFAMIKRNVELESCFIDELLDVTRIERGKMEIVRKDMDLHEAVERAVEVSTPDIQAKGLRLTVALEGSACPFHGDFARLQQVFWNLLKNASKFTPKGGNIEIRSHCRAADEVVVEVTDTGIGLEADVIERIFRPFEQASVSITREFGGLGLGLAIAKATVDAHGGTLRVSSPGPGHGATFTVSLPLGATTADAPEAAD